MRKVNVLAYERKEGDSFYSKVSDGIALFHEWGVSYEEFDAGPANFSVGIIEREDGKIELVSAEMIIFIDKQEKDSE